MEDYNIIRRTTEYSNFNGDEYLSKSEWLALTTTPTPALKIKKIVKPPQKRAPTQKPIPYKDWVLHKTFNLWAMDNNSELRNTFETFIQIYQTNHAVFDKNINDIFKTYCTMVFRSNLHQNCQDYGT